MNGKKGFTLALCAAFMFVSLSIAAPSYGESVLNKIEKTGKVTMGFPCLKVGAMENWKSGEIS